MKNKLATLVGALALTLPPPPRPGSGIRVIMRYGWATG